MVDLKNEEENGNHIETTKVRVRYINDCINYYNDLAWTTKDIRMWLMRRLVNHLEMGNEEMAEYHKAISKEFSENIDLYEKEVAKA